MSLDRLTKNAKQFLHVNGIRYVVALVRYVWFAGVLRRMRSLNAPSADIATHTVMHNLKGIKDLAGSRSGKLIRPLSVIDPVVHLGSAARILSIGPRTEGELLNLLAHGFCREQIKALDLISYSPWVDIGDMHAMPYADGSFDVVIVGWTIAYSENPRKAVQEIIRVARDGAVVAVGVEYHPRSVEELEAESGYTAGSRRRIRSTQELVELFVDRADKVYFAQDIRPEDEDKLGSIVLIVSVRK
jgi:hypothetical protein